MAKIVLSNGKNIEISTVLLNKDQNINVTKTYVTTVKKAVTKVSEDLYKVDNSTKEEAASSQIFEAMKDEVFTTPTVVSEPVSEPSIAAEANVQNVIPELPKVDPIIPTVPVANVDSSNLSPSVEDPKLETSTVTPVVAPEIKPTLDSVVASQPEVSNVNSGVSEVKPILEPISAPVVEPITPVQAEVKEESVPSVQSVADAPTSAPNLFFDGSKETNLNMALGEVSQEKTMSTESDGVQALRQFGSDEPVVAPQEILPEQNNVKTLKRSKGFANNKFFMVIAIAFFVAACVFLGYEAFQYFSISG